MRATIPSLRRYFLWGAVVLALIGLLSHGGPSPCEGRVRWKGVMWKCEREKYHGGRHSAQVPRGKTLLWYNGRSLRYSTGGTP